MTVIDAAPAPTVDDVVGRIKDNVWTLVRADQLSAAMVLLQSVVEDFDRAWSREVRQLVGIPVDAPQLALPAAPDVVTPTAVVKSDEAPELDAVEPVGAEPTTTGSMVYVLNPGGLTKVRTTKGTTRKAS